jgi:hypothetical protein
MMKKSTVIATCLFNSRIAYPLADAEHLVKMEFERNVHLTTFISGIKNCTKGRLKTSFEATALPAEST